MAKRNFKDFFWPSYVDVMTNLFAITLVLFILSFFLFKKINEEQQATLGELKIMKEEYQRVINMNNAIQSLNNNENFVYDKKFQKHILKVRFEYNINEYKIPDGLKNPEVTMKIANVGRSIIETIDNLRKKYILPDSIHKKQAFNIKFLVVIEGQASKIGEEEHNDILSYQRALHLRKYWLNPSNDVTYDGKDFRDPSLRCELIVSGSGFFGSPREPDFIDGKVNTANQRFLVHIVPVIDWNINKKE